MTCIVGLIQKQHIWIGGDDGVAGEDGIVEIRTLPKVFAKGSMLIGGYGSLRVLQVVQYCMHQPAHPKGWSTMKYLLTAWIPSLKKALVEQRVISADPGTTEDNSDLDALLPGSGLVLGYRGELFTVEDDGQVGRTALPYSAVGSGAQFALASLCQQEMLADSRHPETRVRNALEIAAAHIANVNGPFTVISTLRDE